MGKKADEIKRRRAKEAPYVPPAHVNFKITRHFCGPDDVLIDAYTKLEGIAALLSAAGHYPHSCLGGPMVGIGLLIEDIAHQIEIANGDSEDSSQGGPDGG